MAQGSDRLRIFFDGGARPNPGPMEIAVLLRGVATIRRDIGIGTNNDAEWLALIAAAEMAVALGADDVEFVGDAALVVNQASGAWKCRGDALQAHLAGWQTLAEKIARVRVRHVPRSHNLAGIALAKGHPR
jgi:ribonuclease HI